MNPPLNSYGRRYRQRLTVMVAPEVMDDLRSTVEEQGGTLSNFVDQTLRKRLDEEKAKQRDQQSA